MSAMGSKIDGIIGDAEMTTPVTIFSNSRHQNLDCIQRKVGEIPFWVSSPHLAKSGSFR